MELVLVWRVCIGAMVGVGLRVWYWLLELVLHLFEVEDSTGIVWMAFNWWASSLIAEIMPELFIVDTLSESVMSFFGQ